MKNFSVALLTIVPLLVFGAAIFVYSGFYDVRASTPHSAPVNWLLGTTLEKSVKRYADTIRAPDLSADELRLAGINDFNAMCVTCHGATGVEREPLGKGLNPQAPDLAESAAHMTPAELFWVTKHGIKMTGMPAWGETHSDDALWPVVALMTELPQSRRAGLSGFTA